MLKIDKPWGHEVIWAQTEYYVGKILWIEAGEALSLQVHLRKDETILLKNGRLRLQLGTEDKILEPGGHAHIPAGTVHRMIAIETCEIIEVSTPELNDVVRLEDRYGRVVEAERKVAA